VIRAPTREDARLLLTLIAEPHAWLRRRTDQTQLLDPARIRWTTRLDISVPAFGRAGIQDIVLPLLRKSRGLASDLSVTYSTGDMVSHLTYDENVAWAQAALLLAAANALGSPDFSTGVRDLLLRISGRDTQQRDEAVTRFSAWGLHASGSPRAQLPKYQQILRTQPPTDEEAAQILAIYADDLALGLTKGLSAGYWVMVPIPAQPGRDVTLVVHHEEVVTQERRRSRNWRPVAFPIGSAKSYHAAVRLPAGVAFRPRYTARTLNAPQSVSVTKDQLILYFANAPASNVKIWWDVLRSLRLAEGGVKWPARILALGTFAIFLSGLLLRTLLKAQPQTGTAPILVAAISFASAIALQREATEVQRVLSLSLRASLYLAMLAAAFGAGALAIDWPAGAAIPSLDWRFLMLVLGVGVALATAIGAGLVRGFRVTAYVLIAAAVVGAALSIAWPQGIAFAIFTWRILAWAGASALAGAIALYLARITPWYTSVYVAIAVVAVALPFAVNWPQAPLVRSISWEALAWAIGALVAALGALVATATWFRHG